jgi:hypothetical protein
VRWWASLAVIAACQAAPPAGVGVPPRAQVATCKVSTAVCDPAVTDEAALAIVQARCQGCHAEGGKAEHMLLDLTSLLPERGDVGLRLSGCEMPPDNTPLPADERRRLMEWGACAPAGPATKKP